MGVFRRIYRVRPLAAALLCLPGILLSGWYGWKAYASFDRYRRIVDAKVPLTVEDFQMQLHDVLRRDLRRMTMPSQPEPSRIQHFAFHMKSGDMAKLLAGAQLEQQRPYVPAELERGGKLQPLRMRLRGQQHWHLLGKQKSLKVKLPKKELLDGYRVFNLINDPVPMVVGEQIILNLARRKDVLTPRSSFARVSINGSDLGVFRYETQPDESLLRDRHRMPGSIYSGNLPGSAKTEELWRDTKRWKKTAWRNAEEELKYDDIERFLKQINSATVRQFVDFARNEIELEAVATFDALDVAFGGDQHDFRQNHKLYYDPYRGRWELVAWNFRGFKHEAFFNLVQNPILLRLKQVPEYVSIRNRVLYELLVGRASVSAIERRGMKMLKRLAPELASDPNWHAYKLLPRASRFHRRMVRPMTLERAGLVFDSEMATYEKRHSFLISQLRRNPLWIEQGKSKVKLAPELVTGESLVLGGPTAGPRSDSTAPPASKTPASKASEPPRPAAVPKPDDPSSGGMPLSGWRTEVNIIIDGRAGVKVAGFRAKFVDSPCPLQRWQVRRNDVPVSPVAAGDRVELERPIALYPAVGTIQREDANPKRGNVRTRMVPVRYSFSVRSLCQLESIEAWGEQLATGFRIWSRPAGAELLQRVAQKTLGADDVPRFVPGEIAPHPEQFDPPPPQTVRLGPGKVLVTETKVFGAQQTVLVEPGTRLIMAPETSLIFLGKVTLEGTRAKPIRIEPASSAPWGGIALQGPNTEGSSFSHVTITGGTVPKYRLIPYPGMINVHDTRDIAFTNCHFGGNRGPGEIVHAAYVKKLRVRDTVVQDAMGDGWDFEFVRARMRNVEVRRVGDEALDLMDTRLELYDSVLVGCGGNCLSAGEESTVMVRDCLVAAAKVGVLAKNASEVDLAGTLLFRTKTGVRIYKREVRYAGNSEISADVLFVVDSKTPTRRDKKSRGALRLGRLRSRLPHDGSLVHLQRDVLALDNWGQLAPWVEARVKGAKGATR